jgi:hypothetical protein
VEQESIRATVLLLPQAFHETTSHARAPAALAESLAAQVWTPLQSLSLGVVIPRSRYPLEPLSLGAVVPWSRYPLQPLSLAAVASWSPWLVARRLRIPLPPVPLPEPPSLFFEIRRSVGASRTH